MYKFTRLPELNNCTITIIGLGYVGLPLAVQFAKTTKCIRTGNLINRTIRGFDTDKNRIIELLNGIDSTNEINKKDLDIVSQINLSYEEESLYESDVFIVTVPTPIDDLKKPDLDLIKNASFMIGKTIKKRYRLLKSEKYKLPIVIFESTVYPGVTEDICARIIEESSNLKYNEDFFCGYSPERINPGDKNYRLNNIVKVTSGSTPEIGEWVDKLYSSIIDAGTYMAGSIPIAEAAKVIENTQRDLNIALINEFAIIFKKMGLDTLDILDAASTKWNFLKFKPGLVGGHCIGVDPYYLTYKAEELGYNPEIVLSGRRMNDSMSYWIADQVILEMSKRKFIIQESNLLILGLTFKENCPDLRNTKIIDLVKTLKNHNVKIHLVDPNVNIEKAKKVFNLNVHKEIPNGIKFTSILFLVAHDKFKEIDFYSLNKKLIKDGFIFDLKGLVPKDLNPIRI